MPPEAKSQTLSSAHGKEDRSGNGDDPKAGSQARQNETRYARETCGTGIGYDGA